MREILFRGKRIDNGEWVEGIPIQTHIGVFICFDENPHYCSQYGYMEIDKIVMVDETTVCQYTGLTDKNGRKIWEDDIIRYEGKLFQIVWVHGCALFAAHPLKENRVSPCLNVGTMKNAEVVGNIFDNPELIGGKEE